MLLAEYVKFLFIAESITFRRTFPRRWLLLPQKRQDRSPFGDTA